MSHDITAFCKKSGKIISSISIDPFDLGKSWILYESLNCNECNSGVSGSGTKKSFTKKNLGISISKFKYLLGESEDEIRDRVENSLPYKSATLIFNSVIKSAGVNPGENIKIYPDNNSAADVYRFLLDIQYSNSVIVEFN